MNIININLNRQGRKVEDVGKLAIQIGGALILNRFVQEFTDVLGNPDPLTYIIKGQLYIESFMTALLESVFYKPKKIGLERMPFSKKIDLCLAVGIVHDDVAPALRKLAEMRNNFAHQLWPNLTEKEQADFLKALQQSEQLGKELTAVQSKWEGVKGGIIALWAYLAEQSIRVASKRGELVAFWTAVVDAPEANLDEVEVDQGFLDLVRAVLKAS